MTQAAAILDELRRNAGQWVSLPRLHEVSGAYAVHSRVSDLRADGHVIEVRQEGHRPRRSWYRLVVRESVTA